MDLKDSGLNNKVIFDSTEGSQEPEEEAYKERSKKPKVEPLRLSRQKAPRCLYNHGSLGNTSIPPRESARSVGITASEKETAGPQEETAATVAKLSTKLPNWTQTSSTGKGRLRNRNP